MDFNSKQKLLSHIICKGKRKNISLLNVARIDTEVCRRSQILRDNLCFDFYWVTKQLLHKHLSAVTNNAIETCRKISDSKSSKMQQLNVSTIEDVFFSTNLDNITIAIWDAMSSQLYFQTFVRIWMKTQTKARKQMAGFLPCTSEKYKFSTQRDSLYQCPDGRYISTAFVHDGEKDCLSAADESVFNILSKSSQHLF